MGSDDAVGMGETVDGVEANVGAAVRVQDRREGGVAEVAGVAACVEVVGWLLEEHELQSSSAVEGLLGAAVVVGLEGVGGGVECCVGGGTSIVRHGGGQQRRRKGHCLLQAAEFQAFATAVGGGPLLGE